MTLAAPYSWCKDAKVQHDDHGDECFQDQDELALRDQVGFAGFIDQLGNFTHRAMNRQVLELHVDHQAKEQAKRAEDQSNGKQLGAVDAIQERNLAQVRQLQIGFTAGF